MAPPIPWARPCARRGALTGPRDVALQLEHPPQVHVHLPGHRHGRARHCGKGHRRRARPPAALRAQSAVGQACARAPMRPANRVLLRWRSATELGMSNGPQEHHQRAGSPGQIQSGRLCHRLRRLPLRLRRPRSRAAAESARVLIVSYTTVGRPSVAYEFSASRAAPALSSPEPGFVICSPAGRWPAPRAATGCLRRSVEKVLVDAPGQRPAARPRKSQTGLALFLLKVLLTTATVPTVPARSGTGRRLPGNADAGAAQPSGAPACAARAWGVEPAVVAGRCGLP